MGALSGGAPVTPLQPSEVAPAIPADAVFEPAVYVPRALLTVGPVARAPVLLDWPANWLARGTYRGVLKLYLDEQGRVERVEADDDTALPGPLFDVARAAFRHCGIPGSRNVYADQPRRYRRVWSISSATPVAGR